MGRFNFSFGMLLIANIFGGHQTWAIDACEAVRQNLGAGPGQLINLRTNTIINQFTGTPLSKTQDLRLAYIVPAGQYLTGALIVKARHQLPKDATAKSSEGFPSSDFIRVQRQAYTAPCSNQRKGSYDTNVKLEHYVDQHFYGIAYPSMDEFHAEVGYRSRHYSVAGFGYDKSVCKNTSDPESRMNFLYSEDPRIATPGEYYARRTAKLAKQVGFISEAFADQAPRYKDKLHTLIVPYQRANPTSDNCVSFEIGVPDKAGKTEVEIIDTDKGRTGFFSTWQINWEQN
ncbi:MAG: hypothetical protein WDN50_22015 [Bradyrhizobium sp.]